MLASARRVRITIKEKAKEVIRGKERIPGRMIRGRRSLGREILGKEKMLERLPRERVRTVAKEKEIKSVCPPVILNALKAKIARWLRVPGDATIGIRKRSSRN